MIKMSLKTILEKFPPETRVRVSYHNEKESCETTLSKLGKRKIMAMTILHPKPIVKNHNGEPVSRDGFRVEINNE